MVKRLPPDVLEFFRKQGANGEKIRGKVGGKRSLETMTPEGCSETCAEGRGRVGGKAKAEAEGSRS